MQVSDLKELPASSPVAEGQSQTLEHVPPIPENLVTLVHTSKTPFP